MTIIAGVSQGVFDKKVLASRKERIWKTAQAHRIMLPTDVLDFLVNLALDDEQYARFLEALIVYATKKKQPITVETAQAVLTQKHSSIKDRSVQAKIILEEVCTFFGFQLMDLLGDERYKEVVLARRIAMVLLLEHSFSTTKTAELVGKTDHTTAIYARERFHEEVAINPALAANVTKIRSAIKQRLAS